MAENKIKAVIYARVSTDDKDQNPETQLFHCREYCENAGYEIVGEYVDKARARDFVNRKNWQRLLKDGRQHRYKVVIALRMDRLFRSVKECANVLTDWYNSGIKFKSVTEDVIDTTTSSGRFITWIISAVGELESSTIGDRVRAGMQRARAEGKPLGRKPLPINIELIVQTLRISRSITEAAGLLKCSRRTITRECKKYNVEVSDIIGTFVAPDEPGKNPG